MTDETTPGIPRDDAGRIPLLDLTPGELEAAARRHFESRDEPGYRADQLRRWIYEQWVPSFEEMTNLPKEERAALARRFSLDEPEPATVRRSEDGTVKHLWRLDDGELVESVLIPTPDRLTLCVSSQAGCALGCTFCSTGWGGFRRNLSPGEIVSQYRASARFAEDEEMGAITNIVFMGMGEPLANRKAVMPALTTLNHGHEVGARRITVSTVGMVPGIIELAKRPEQFRLALSLHAPNHELRRRLIPLEERYPLPEVLDALRTFDEAGGRRITFEYTMIRGVNDAPELAVEVADLAREFEAFVNLIPFNPIPDVDWVPSEPEAIRAFREILEEREVATAVREPRGRDIAAACGQLRVEELDSGARARVAEPIQIEGVG